MNKNTQRHTKDNLMFYINTFLCLYLFNRISSMGNRQNKNTLFWVINN